MKKMLMVRKAAERGGVAGKCRQKVRRMADRDPSSRDRFLALWTSVAAG